MAFVLRDWLIEPAAWWQLFAGAYIAFVVALIVWILDGVYHARRDPKSKYAT